MNDRRKLAIACAAATFLFPLLALSAPGDIDDDGILDAVDNCPLEPNPGQEDLEYDPNFDSEGDSHPQPDGVGAACDNCVGRGSPWENQFLPDPLPGWRNHNAAQVDLDGDGLGDSCDDDMDGDGVPNSDDNCPYTPNPTQAPAGSEIGDACPQPAFPVDFLDLDYEVPHHFSIDTDTIPIRGELRFSFSPPSAANDVEVTAFCNGDDYFNVFTAYSGPDRDFPDAVAIKVDHTDTVVSPLHLRPDLDLQDQVPLAQPQDGQWVVPFLMLLHFRTPFPDGYDDPDNVPTDLACYVQLHRAPTSSATGRYGVRVVQRVKPANTRSLFHCPVEVDPACDPDPDEIRARSDKEYGFFEPSPDTYTLLDAGDPTLGTCAFDDQIFEDVISYTPIPGARGWNCCTWFYAENDPPVISETGFSTFWEGSIPPDADALPDQDADGVMDRCDNCPEGFANRDQSDIDFDTFGDLCDNCFDLDNLSQQNTDSVAAGDACQCSDVDSSGGVDIRDVAAMSRFSVGFGAGTAFDYDRCRVGIGPFRCTTDGVVAVRQALSGAAAPLVESCP